MTRLTRFGTGTQEYNLSSNIVAQSLDATFGDVVTETKRLPAMDGGFDEYGTGRTPSAVGSVRLQGVLVASDPDEMDAKRRDLMTMLGWGKKQLWRSVAFDTAEQWCYARVDNVQLSEDHKTPDLRQTVTIIFQVSDPFWYGQGSETVTWGSGAKWAEGWLWGGTATPISAAGLQTDSSIEVGGNAHTFPRIVIAPESGDSCENPTVQRLVDGTVIDEVKYVGTLTDSDSLTMNCRSRTVTVNSVNAFATFTHRRGAWFELQAGVNSIRVKFANAGDAASVKLLYYVRYR